MADISFNIACKELKIAQIAQLNQLFQLFLFSSYIRPRLLWVKSHANEEKCKKWRRQRFTYKQRESANVMHNSAILLLPYVAVYDIWAKIPALS